MRLVLLGPPGAGKGTLASLIKETDNSIAHISTGDLFREEMKNESEVGSEAKSYIDKGELVPDEVVTKIIENKLVSDETSNFMLDGFPRTKNQAIDLNVILKNVSKPLDMVVYMDTTLPVVIKRLTGRRLCKKCGHVYHVLNRPPKQDGVCDSCGSGLYQREDDKEDTIKNRMEVYMQNTLPIVDYYKDQGILCKLDGDKESEDLQKQLLKIFNEESS